MSYQNATHAQRYRMDSNEQAELAHDGGGECNKPDRVSAVDFGHDKEYEERFFDEIVNDSATIKALIEFHRSPSITNSVKLREQTARLAEDAARELSE